MKNVNFIVVVVVLLVGLVGCDSKPLTKEEQAKVDDAFAREIFEAIKNKDIDFFVRNCGTPSDFDEFISDRKKANPSKIELYDEAHKQARWIYKDTRKRIKEELKEYYLENEGFDFSITKYHHYETDNLFRVFFSYNDKLSRSSVSLGFIRVGSKIKFNGVVN